METIIASVVAALLGLFFLYLLYRTWSASKEKKGYDRGYEAAKVELNDSVEALKLDRQKFNEKIGSEYSALDKEKEAFRRQKQASEAALYQKDQELSLKWSKSLQEVQNSRQRQEQVLAAKEIELEHLREKLFREVDEYRKSQDAEVEAAWLDLQEPLRRVNAIEDFVSMERRALETIAKEPLSCIPTVADMTSDCIYTYDNLVADALELKKRPAVSGARKVREYASRNRELYQQLMIYKYRSILLEQYFPWITEFYDLSLKDVSDMVAPHSISWTEEDPVDAFLSDNERMVLSADERAQIALDRYVKSSGKTKWQLVRDYEMYIAHLFREDGYDVDPRGSLLRFDNIGRFLFVRRGKRAALIFCKYLSPGDTVHEKLLFQLFGAGMCYQIDHPSLEIACIISTNAKCSVRAHSFAERMRMLVQEGIEIGNFPRIKCAVSSNGEKLFYLPMDPRYDSVFILRPDECFVYTVDDAVALGFHRAFRKHGA